MKLSRLYVSAAIALTAACAMAVPARRGLFPVTQPDGSVIMIQRVGDEFNHLTLDADGRILRQQPDGAYYLARLSTDGTIEATDILAGSEIDAAAAPAPVDAPAALRALNEGRQASLSTAGAPNRAIAQSGMGRFSGNFPRTGKVRGLVILAQYSDVKFTLADPKAYFSDMLMKPGFNQYKGTGSAYDYFIQNSEGRFDPQFDVYGPVTLPKARSYYGGNDSSGDDKNPQQMIVDACKALDSEINYADYDMDNDGYVDNVFLFYAGQGEADYGPEDSVWPHQWQLAGSGAVITLDGKRINKYACSNEWDINSPDGVGTFIHEFSHVMGLPDLYDPAYAVRTTPGEWSVLDSGPYNNNGRTPPNYSIFERNAMGWCEPRVIKDPEHVTLEEISASNTGCIIATSKSTEFFLLENRQRTGWDKYIPNHGLLIWHIDFVQSVWDRNAVNSTASHQYVEIEPANNNKNAPTGWSWPGSSKATSFTSTTSPALKTWTNKAVNVPITDIAEAGGIVSFDVSGGIPPVEPPTAAPEPTDVTTDGFRASWGAVDGATDYLITVMEHITSRAATTVTYDGETLPEGWTTTVVATDKYTNTGNYGAAAPSVKLSKTGQQITTAIYDIDITSVSLWHKGQQNSGDTYLLIEGSTDGSSWQEIDRIVPVKNTASTYNNATIPMGIKQMRFTFNKENGNLAVDDIAVTMEGDRVVVMPEYNARSTNGETTFMVDVTRSSAVKFSYYICSTDGKTVSKPSNIVEVDLTDAPNSAGVDDVAIDDADAPVEYYNLQGIRVETPARGGLYIRRQGSKAEKVMVK